VIGELLAGAWEAVTLGELLGGVGLLGGGAGTVYLARGVVRALVATTRALELWGRHLEASTAAARSIARLGPLAAEALRCSIRDAGGKVPADEEDSDELQVLRVAAEGDEAELARWLAKLEASDPESTLNRRLTRTEQRMVQLLQAARRKRKTRDPDAPEPRDRERTSSWLRRKAPPAKA